MAKRKPSSGSKAIKREAMSKFGTRVEGNYAPVGSHAIGMDGPAKLIVEGKHGK